MIMASAALHRPVSPTLCLCVAAKKNRQKKRAPVGVIEDRYMFGQREERLVGNARPAGGSDIRFAPTMSQVDN